MSVESFLVDLRFPAIPNHLIYVVVYVLFTIRTKL